jgi:site-specific recombinase XerD
MVGQIEAVAPQYAISEALQIDVYDLDLTRDDEHIHVLGKGGHRRTVLLDAPKLVTLLRRYLLRRRKYGTSHCFGR